MKMIIIINFKVRKLIKNKTKQKPLMKQLNFPFFSSQPETFSSIDDNLENFFSQNRDPFRTRFFLFSFFQFFKSYKKKKTFQNKFLYNK